jgi:two-component system, NarL family, sensor kinase
VTMPNMGDARRTVVAVTAAPGTARWRWRPAGLAWTLWALALLGLVATFSLDSSLRRAGLPELAFLLGGNLTLAVAALSAATVGAVVAGRRPRHRVGWLLVALGLAISASALTFSYTRYGLVARPGALPAAGYLAGFANGAVFVYLSLTGFVLLLTPTGGLPSPRWRWWARVEVAALVVAFVSSLLHPRPLYPEHPEIDNPLGVPALEGGTLTAAFPMGALLILAGLVVGAGSLGLRFRRARGTERQQLRWLTVGAALASVALLVALTALVVEDGAGLIFQAALGVSVALLPLATGAAILRYRLYDLDYLVSRAVVYGLLTGAGVAVYVAVVELAEWLLREGLGVGGSLLATAVIALGFAPARDRLQHVVDRRLYGEREDPVRAVARLGERLRDGPARAPGGDVLAGVLQEVCQTLRLPSASLRLDDGAEVAWFGRPGAARESIPLDHEGQRIGELLVGARTGEQGLRASDRRVLGILAAPVAVALHAVLLTQELQRSREQVVATREEERRRLRRDLHDGLGPILTAVTLKADAARSALGTAPDRTDALLAELRGDARLAIGDLRRVVDDLRPASLDKQGLVRAVREQVDRFARQGLSIDLRAPAALPVLPAAVEVAAYRITTEALTNVARHAHAHRVTVTVTVTAAGDLRLEVRDDGAASRGRRDGWPPGMGLRSMAERAAEVGGTLQAGPTPAGGRVLARLPLELA